MRIGPRSLRWRLQAWYGVLLLIVLCAFGFTAFHLEKTERLHRVDTDLQRRLSALVNALRGGQGRASPEGTRQPPPPNLKFSPEVEALFAEDTSCYYVVWMRGPNPISRSANAPADVPRPSTSDEIVRTRNGQMRETFL